MTNEQFIMKVHAIAKIGLKFSHDPYAIENYEELMELSTEMINRLIEEPLSDSFYVRDLYPTPNISCRVIITNDENEILMVKETDDGLYSLPGGWCDVFESPKENAIKECRQETGYDVRIDRLLGIFFRDQYKPKNESLISEYSVYFSGKIIGGDNKFNHEVLETKFFNENNLPILSVKNSEIEFKRALKCYYEGTSDFD